MNLGVIATWIVGLIVVVLILLPPSKDDPARWKERNERKKEAEK